MHIYSTNFVLFFYSSYFIFEPYLLSNIYFDFLLFSDRNEQFVSYYYRLPNTNFFNKNVATQNIPEEKKIHRIEIIPVKY